MPELEKILIIHDTFLSETDVDFKRWLLNFRKNIYSVTKKNAGLNVSYELSMEQSEEKGKEFKDQIQSYNNFLIIVHNIIHKNSSLTPAIRQLQDYIQSVPEFFNEKKLIVVLLKSNLTNQQIFTFQETQYVHFFSERKDNYTIKTSTYDIDDRSYWTKIFEISDLVFPRQSIPHSNTPILKDETFVYLGRTTRDLRDQRDQLKSNLELLGINVLPESETIQLKDLDADVLEPLFGKCDLFIQMMGAEFEKFSGRPEYSGITQESDIISKYLEDKPIDILKKRRTRIIWIPEDTLFIDYHKDIFIQRIKKTILFNEDNTEILISSFEQMEKAIYDTLKIRIKHIQKVDDPGIQDYIYILHEKTSIGKAEKLASLFEKHSMKTILTHELHQKKNFIQNHKNSINNCEAIILYYGLENLSWFESMIKEIIKANIFTRSAPFKFKIIVGEEKLLQTLPNYDDFIYIDMESLSNQSFFNDHFLQMIG